MKTLNRKSEILVNKKKMKLTEALDTLIQLPSIEITRFFTRNNKSLPRDVRIHALRLVLDEQVKNIRVLEKTLSDEVNYRLNWYQEFSEFQLETLLATLKNRDLEVKFREELWIQFLQHEVELGLDDVALFRLINIGKNYRVNNDALENIEVFNDGISPIFYDEEGTLDGLTPEAFRDVLFNSSTLVELRLLGKKYGVDVPRRIKKDELAQIIIEELTMLGKYTPEHDYKINRMSVMALQRFAKDNDIKASIELKKEEIIEYILSHVDEAKELKMAGLRAKLELEMAIPLEERVIEPEVVVPKVVVPVPVVEEVVEEPVVEEVVEEPVVEEIVEEPVVEEIVEEPVIEEIVEEPVIEEIVEEPVIEEIVEEPVVEEIVEEPVIEEIIEEPVVEEIVEETVIVEIIEETETIEIIEEIETIEIIEEPVTEEIVEEPVVEAPVVKEVVKAPVVEEIIEPQDPAKLREYVTPLVINTYDKDRRLNKDQKQPKEKQVKKTKEEPVAQGNLMSRRDRNKVVKQHKQSESKLAGILIRILVFVIFFVLFLLAYIVLDQLELFSIVPISQFLSSTPGLSNLVDLIGNLVESIKDILPAT